MENDIELQALRRKKLESLRTELETRQALNEFQEELYEKQIDIIMRQILTPEAKSRLSTLKLAKPLLAQQVEEQLILLLQSGQLRGKIDDNTLRAILGQIASRKKEINIRRK